jgi:hypothetical protein
MNPKKKMKGSKRPRQKVEIRIISRTEMTAEQQEAFTTATDSLLAELVKSLDRQVQGDPNGIEEQVAGKARDHRRAAK